MIKSNFLTAVFLFLFFAGIVPIQAGTKTWKPTTTGDWFAAANWLEGGDYPRAGDIVVITNTGASVLLTNSTEYLSSITLSAPGLSANTLVFSNWNTKLSATNVYVRTNAIVTLPPAFTDTQMSNNVYIVCSNLTIDTGGNINVDIKGFASGAPSSPGYGPGGSYFAGGYGGMGSGAGLIYGSSNAPVAPGSGGSSGSYGPVPGGPGGGAVRIEASGSVAVNGIITANGGPLPGYNSQAGSGGGIYITCNTLSGSGTIAANGGANGGGGGRIAVIYIPAAQGSIAIPTVQFSANGGSGFLGDLGTLYFPDNRLLTETITHSGQWTVPGFTNWGPNSLTISNGWIGFRIAGFQLRVTNDVTVNGASARLEIGGNQVIFTNAINGGAWRYIFSDPTGPVFTCGGSLILTNGGGLTVYAGPTNGIAPDYGALVAVTNDVYVGNGSWIYPFSHWTNGGSVLVSMNRLTIWTNGGFNATGAGYRGGGFNDPGFGPGGGGYTAGGGSYGGLGAKGCGSSTYGSPSAPLSPGSGGGGGGNTSVCGYPGGGAVRIQARDRITAYGSILADGIGGGAYPGAGSGGGIYLTCRIFDGSSNGLLRANGGNMSWYGQSAGGGGRIAVIYNTNDQAAVPAPGVQFTALGVNEAYGTDIGTLYFPDTKLLAETLNWSGKLVIPGFTRWAPNNLTIANGWLGFRMAGFQLVVTNNIVISGASGKLEMGGNQLFESSARYFYSDPNGPTLSCGSLTLTNGGRLYMYCAATNTPGAYGALVRVGGDLKIADTNCWIYPQSHPANGGSVLFQVGNLLITTTNAGINAISRGFADGYGPGAKAGSGGGYGGFGGAGGLTYGSSNAPVDPGSGGVVLGTAGGGLVRVQATGMISIYGSILADVVTCGGPYTSGSGGGIYLSCKKFYGSPSGALEAKGGDQGWGAAGSGGGGRIAIWRMVDLSGGQIPTTVTNGIGLGTPGTIVWGWIPPPGTWFVIH